MFSFSLDFRLKKYPTRYHPKSPLGAKGDPVTALLEHDYSVHSDKDTTAKKVSKDVDPQYTNTRYIDLR